MSVAYEREELAASEPLLSDRDAKARQKVMGWIQDARKARAAYEPGWQQCLAFAAGEQHLQYDDRGSRKLFLPDLKDGEERATADKIMQYRNTALGELTGDDDRPEIQFSKEDLPSEEYAKTANLAVEYGWEVEWQADRKLLDVKRTLVDLGTAAICTRFDSTVGKVRMRVPHLDGKPILDMEQARAHVADMAAQGRTADFRDIHEGRTVWEIGRASCRGTV